MRLKEHPPTKIHYFQNNLIFFGEIFRDYLRHLAISAANFSISTLVLPKQQRFKHKRRFSQASTRKAEPFWILLKQKMIGGSGTSWTIYKSFTPCCRQITMPLPHHLCFYRPDALSIANQQCQSTECNS